MNETAELEVIDEPKLVTNVAPPEILSSVGQMLAEARESLGLDIEKIAKRLNLGIETIRSIEMGRKEGLPPRTFIRGHICSYAKIVNLDVGVVLPLWEKENPPVVADTMNSHESDKRIRSMRRKNRSMKNHRKRKGVVWFGLAILIAIVLGLSFLSLFDKNSNHLTQTTSSQSHATQRELTAVASDSAVALPLNETETAPSNDAGVVLPLNQDESTASNASGAALPLNQAGN